MNNLGQGNVSPQKNISPQVLGFTDSTQFNISKIFSQARDEPIITSLLDTDFYKFPMSQLQREWIPEEDQALYSGLETWGEADVTFSWINRHHATIKPHEVIDINELREQLNAARELSFQDAELSYLRGMPLDPEMKNRMFSGWFIRELKDFKLPDFDLSTNEDNSFKLDFHGKWEEVTYWEIIAMSIISEMYFYGLIKKYDLPENKISQIYEDMYRRLENMSSELGKYMELRFAEFGTRRRHSKYWQKMAYETLKEKLGDILVGTSNTKLSMEQGSANPIGTNAHEMSSVVANLGDDSDEYIMNSQYFNLKRWAKMYPELLIYLPDTFGTQQFHDNAPDWLELEKWTGPRVDSMPEDQAAKLMLKYYRSKRVDAVKDGKLIMPSDGLNTQRLIDNQVNLSQSFSRVPQACGTHVTNDSKGIIPEIPEFRSFSQVCKVTQANGKSAVKLSDNPEKAIGTPERIERFKKIFGTKGMKKQKISV